MDRPKEYILKLSCEDGLPVLHIFADGDRKALTNRAAIIALTADIFSDDYDRAMRWPKGEWLPELRFRRKV